MTDIETSGLEKMYNRKTMSKNQAKAGIALKYYLKNKQGREIPNIEISNKPGKIHGLL